MPRHASYVPHGVIPAALLPFDSDFAIDEAGFRKHLRDLAAVEGLSAIAINAHSTEVASCTFDEQRRVLEIAQDEVGGRLPLITASGRTEASRLRVLPAWRRRAVRRRYWYFHRLRSPSVSRRPWRSRISDASLMQPTSR